MLDGRRRALELRGDPCLLGLELAEVALELNAAVVHLCENRAAVVANTRELVTRADQLVLRSRELVALPYGTYHVAADGYVDLSDDVPGLGLTVNEKALEQFDVLE